MYHSGIPICCIALQAFSRAISMYWTGDRYAAYANDDETLVVARRDRRTVLYTRTDAVTLRTILSRIGNAEFGDLYVETMLGFRPKTWDRPEDCYRRPANDLGMLTCYYAKHGASGPWAEAELNNRAK
jgi:hypothetical protein